MHGNMNVKFIKTNLPSISVYKIMNKYYYVFYSLLPTSCGACLGCLGSSL